MNKKIFSLGIGILVGIFLFIIFSSIKNIFTNNTNSQVVSLFSSSRGRFSGAMDRPMGSGSMMPNGSGMVLDEEGISRIANRIGISTGELQAAIDGGKNIQEIMQGYGISMTGSRNFPNTSSGTVSSGTIPSAAEIFNSNN